ncbi:MAG: ATP-binding protein [Parasphingorhabdus sp.]
MSGGILSALAARLRRWPLTRQISLLFAVAMVGNAMLIIVATDAWGNYAFVQGVSELPPDVREILQKSNDGQIPTPEEWEKLSPELETIVAELDDQSDLILYTMVLVAAAATYGIGYLAVGRLGRGLSNVGAAARSISEGDLSVRARRSKFTSSEESRLADDFNAMAASLERAERELAESTASIAHELRTPLTVLRGRLHGIADGVFDLEPGEITGLILQVEGLGRLVDDLQTLSLANSQRLVLTLEEIDLAEEVHRVLAVVGPDLEKANLEASLKLDAVPLAADGMRVRQVIIAVLSNVVRYAPDSGMLKIATFVAGDDAVLQITDSGPGLPSGAETLAFDRFWRGEASRNRNTGGSGLGLAVVRTIVEAHRGHVFIRNADEGGTVVEMRLPHSSDLQQFSTKN